MLNTLKITQPDDMHLHLRDGAALASVINSAARQFARGIIMPNLTPPVTKVEQAVAYRERILKSLADGVNFEPLMTLYLTDNTSVMEIQNAADSEFVHAVKYYPAGATFNADSGVTRIENVYPVLEKMAELNLPLLMHGEVTDPGIDIFDRESVFIETVLAPLMKSIPGLRIVFEHITTKEAVEFVEQGPGTLAATITPHHLLYSRNELFRSGIRPHYYCLPVLKREQHRQALVAAATGGDKKFFLGTDSAPHAKSSKESECGCAGIYSAPAAIEFYAEIFELAGALDKLEAFASHFGADFYGIPRNETSITIERKNWVIPPALPFADEQIIPMKAGETCSWQILKNE